MEQTTPLKSPRFWIGIGFSLACLGAIFLFIKPSEIWEAFRTARYEYVALGAFGFVAFMFLRAVRWRWMLANQVPYSQLFHVQSVGYMLTNLLPFRIGDVARAVLIGNVPPITIAQGVSTMVVERVLDLLFMVVLLPLTVAQVGSLPSEIRVAAQSAGILAIIATFILILAANQRQRAVQLGQTFLRRIPFLDTESWSKRIDELLGGLSSLSHWHNAIPLVLLSIVLWMPILAAYYAVLLAVHLQPTWAMAGFVVCAAAFSIAAPSSPGQVGVFHAGVTFALVQILEQPQAESASFAFLYHALTLLLSVLLGVVGLRFIGATLNNVVDMTRRFTNKRV